MKLETMIKWGALGVAAATTAAGSVLITAKAVKKLETETFPEDPTKKGLDMKNVPAIDKLVSGSLKISNKAKEELTKDEEPIFKSDFKYTAPVTPTETPAPAPIPEPIPTPTPEPMPTPVVAPVPEPVVVPVPDPTPVAIPTPIPEPIPTPIVESVPEVKPEEEKYTYVPMDLPYLAGKLGKDDEECKEVVITPAEAEAEAEEKEPITTETESMPIIETPVLEIPVVDSPVAEISAEPIASAEVETVEEQEPEIVLPTAEMIDEHPNTTPVLGAMEKPAETFADINPLAQGFSVAMSDNVENALPTATEAASTFADFAPVNATAPITFNDLNSEYVEEISPVVEVKSDPVGTAPVVEAPVAEAAPVVEAPVAEAAPVVEAPVAEAAPATTTPQGKSVTIGGAVVSDLATDSSVMAVANTYHIPIGNLVSITAEGNAPMVFEFLYSDMRNDATLMNVYFMLPDGQATLPPEADRENVLAFGRNFITGNEELKSFLA